MIINNYVETIVNPTTKKYYENLGYESVVGEKILVRVEDLKDNSSVYEERKCDCCGTIYGSTHQALLKSFKAFNEDICPECVKTEKYKEIQKNHRKQTNLVKFGTNTPAENQIVKEKIKNTNLQTYGVVSTLQTEEVKEKIKITLLSEFGVDNPMKSEAIKEKAFNTNFKKYGCKNPQQNIEVQERTAQTNVKKYGVRYTTQVPEVRKKMAESLYLHGKVATSSQQYYIYKRIPLIFNEGMVELNKPFESYSLDIEFVFHDIKIDIEYDGSYWHQNEEKDETRDEKSIQAGYKVLRIKSKKTTTNR